MEVNAAELKASSPESSYRVGPPALSNGAILGFALVTVILLALLVPIVGILFGVAVAIVADTAYFGWLTERARRSKVA
jgi:hypothetical protein